MNIAPNNATGRTVLTRLTRSLIALVTCSALSTSAATAQPLFFEDFEGGDLSQWVGKGGGGHNAEIVPDPVRLDNQALNFTALNAAGDIFGFLKTVTFGLSYILEFEYLGVLEPGGVPDDLGGTIGFSDGTPGGHRWLAGTRLCCFIENALLVDDGQWRTYTIEFDPFRDFFPVNNRIRVMVEDFFESGGIAGDAFFDNPFSEAQFRTVKYRPEFLAGSARSNTRAPSAAICSRGTTTRTITAA